MSIVRTPVTEPQRDVVAAHQPGQDVFKSVLSEEIDWKPFAAFPPAVLPGRLERRLELPS